MSEKLNWRANILASIIAALLVSIFIQPILNTIWNSIISSGSTVYKHFIDGAYQSAALGHRNHTDFIILFYFFLVIWFSISIRWLPLLFTLGSIKEKEEEVGDHVKSEEEAPKEGIRSKAALLIVAKLAIILGFTIGLLSTFGLLFIGYVDLQTNTSFQQRLTVLAPRISDQEYKEFLASWASMRSRKDYDLINERLNVIAEEKGIVLPEPLLK